MARRHPNIVVIMCHDLGRHLGCYGVDVATPQIDRLADSGVLARNYFVTSPQCSPSRGSFYTGRHPHVNGLMGLAHGNWELHREERLLPGYLAELGYETHLFGLQHITHDPTRLPFDHVHSAANLSPDASVDVHEAHRADTVAHAVTDVLAHGAYSEPFYASIGLFELHRIQEDDGRFGFDPTTYGTVDPDSVPELPYLPDRPGIRQDLAEMHGMIEALDEAVGAICEALAKEHLAEDTLVIFTTEHGIPFPRAKGMCYDPGIEAALLLRYPPLTDGRDHLDSLLSSVDVLPTILDLLGMQPSRPLDGQSFLPHLTDEGDPGTRECIFAEMTWHDQYNPIRAIRTPQYKYIRNFWCLPEVYLPNDTFASYAGREVREEFCTARRPYRELYDLAASPHERRNVVDDPGYAEVRDRLDAQLHKWMRDTADPLLNGPVLPGEYSEIVDWES